MVKNIPSFQYGTIWEDAISGHRIGCLNVSKKEDIKKIMDDKKATLAIQDPPYNVDINDEFGNLPLDRYIKWSEQWIDNTIEILDKNSSLYIWLGADLAQILRMVYNHFLIL